MKELIYSTRIVDDVEIFIDDSVADDEIEIDYFFPRNVPRYTVKMKTGELFPELFEAADLAEG